MLTEEIIKEELEDYINEEITSDDMREIRKLIRYEIAEIFFDLFKQRKVWV